MRNPMNSWEKSDSGYTSPYQDGCINSTGFSIGSNDLDLMKRLRSAGTDHRKFMRMIAVYADITAPTFWWAEYDTYKVGTVRNSCSFMHKGVSKPFTIDDFSIKNHNVYNILRPLEKKEYKQTFPYETTEFKIFTDTNGRTYRVYRNGKIIQESYTYIDNYGTGRLRTIPEQGAKIYQNKDGYFLMRFAGRDGGNISVHKLVATMWCQKTNEEMSQVNHINGNKGDNSAENLEWVTPSENIQKAVKMGLYDNLNSFHRKYNSWKSQSKVIPTKKRLGFMADIQNGLTHRELAKKYRITPTQANNIRSSMKKSLIEEDFQEAYIWDTIISQLNMMRSLYLETKDEKIFQGIRCLLPSGYMQKSTVMLNYEVLANMYRSRKTHRLDEWVEFCEWIETLPYSELITGKDKENVK